ncbi:uncharacterized protein LOC127254413 [Andrographis paniculata]|uniref:uncharacterized protein LOC127254413 n=1 Tax=Andrographis paniculata TaxID=175694 RepID=UPI0021E983DE|nr:uncharacterized protein LOC127254413 [Andrographis paniculata]
MHPPTLQQHSPLPTNNILHSNNNNYNNNNNNNSKNRTRDLSTGIRRHHHPPPPPPRNHSSSSTQVCAACKYQRRKCASDCILAPYFPHDRQRQFLNAHRLFGVSNIVKIVRHLDPPAKDHAMRTIIFQSDARAADPVGGCYRMIRDLEDRISLAKAELEIVLHHLAVCRAAAAASQAGPVPDSGEAPAMHAGDLGPYDDDEKWTGEDEVVNSWGCNVSADSISDSFPHQNNNLEECPNDMRPILEHLNCNNNDGDDENDDNVREDDRFGFDADGNIVLTSKNGVLTEEKGLCREEEDCFSCVEDHSDLKASDPFFSLTNCDI